MRRRAESAPGPGDREMKALKMEEWDTHKRKKWLSPVWTEQGKESQGEEVVPMLVWTAPGWMLS